MSIATGPISGPDWFHALHSILLEISSSHRSGHIPQQHRDLNKLLYIWYHVCKIYWHLTQCSCLIDSPNWLANYEVKEIVSVKEKNYKRLLLHHLNVSWPDRYYIWPLQGFEYSRHWRKAESIAGLGDCLTFLPRSCYSIIIQYSDVIKNIKTNLCGLFT